MKRREFNLLGLGLLASSLPIAIAACQSDSEPVADAGGGGEFVALGSEADLDAQGSLTSDDFQGEKIAVIRDPGGSGAVLAVSTVCTHAGCTVDWDGAEGKFVCPCHGGSYNPDGTVSGGPPPQSLTTFVAKAEGGQVMIQM
jgi:cytochrome b6-f complex iron-sulfur subunit